MKLGYFMQKTTIKDTFNDRTNFILLRQNGIWVKFYQFWCKNDGEKLSRKKISLKFLHPGDYFSLLNKSVQNHKLSNKNNHLPAWRDFKINFSRSLLG